MLLHNGHITACYSRLDTDILLSQAAWAQVGYRENSTYHPQCTAHIYTFCVVSHSCNFAGCESCLDGATSLLTLVHLEAVTTDVSVVEVDNMSSGKSVMC